LRPLAISLAVLAAVLRTVARAGGVLLPAGALSPWSPLSPDSVNGTQGRVAFLGLFEFVSGAIVTAEFGSFTLTLARPRATSASGAAHSPNTPWLPLTIDGTGTHVTILRLSAITVAVLATVEWSVARACSLGEAACACLRAVAPLSPWLPGTIDGAFDHVARLLLRAISVAIVTTVERTFTFASPELLSSSALLVTFAPRGPFLEHAVDGTLGSTALLGLTRLTGTVLSSEEGSLAISGPGLGASAAGDGTLIPFPPIAPFAVDGAVEVVASFRFLLVTNAGFAAIGDLRARTSASARASAARLATFGPGGPRVPLSIDGALLLITIS